MDHEKDVDDWAETWAAGGEPSASDFDGICPACSERLGDDRVEVTTPDGTSEMCPACWALSDAVLRHEAQALADGATGPAERVTRELSAGRCAFCGAGFEGEGRLCPDHADLRMRR